MQRALTFLLLLLLAAPAIATAPEGDICLKKGGELEGDVSLKCPPRPCPPTQSPTRTNTPTATGTITDTPTRTRTSTATRTATNTTNPNTATATPTFTATPTSTATGTSTQTSTATPTAQSLVSWCPYALACWHMNEASDTTRLNDPLTSAGSAADLAVTNTVAKDTTNKIEGTGAADFDGTETLSCAFATCGTAINAVNNGDASWGGYFRSHTDASTGDMRFASSVAGGNQSFGIGRDATNDSHFCTITQTDTTRISLDSNANTYVVDAMSFAACTMDDAGNTLSTCVAGTGVIGCNTTTAQQIRSVAAGTGVEFGTASLTGQIDDFWIFDNCKLSASDMCKLCSCASNMTLCTATNADPTQYQTTGVNSSTCGSCTLPAANVNAPSCYNTFTPTPAGATATSTQTSTATPTSTSTATSTPTPVATSFAAACSFGDCATIEKIDNTPTYPPAGATLVTSNVLTAQRSLSAFYDVANAGICWTTSGLGDTITVADSCTLEIKTSSEVPGDADARNLTVSWRDSDAGWGAGDYSLTAGTDANAGIDITTISANTVLDIPLTGCQAHVDLTGRTCVQLWVDGGQPAGSNLVDFKTSVPAPVLQITYQP